MRLNEIRYTDSVPIDGYGPGFFRIGGKVVQGPVLVFPTGVAPWDGFSDTGAIIDRMADVDVVFVGTGAEIAHLPAEFRTTLEQAGIGVESMASPAACRTYNVLLSEGRRVAVALIPV
ncbi:MULTISPECIES: Mth938-like domain-containing protein [unclassified Yoonia]|uniref:Mth938-like domain-containing protein n=1 Tax=unclassified Yoonia TaxID=2629118 RepID=UPI002AFFF767|nr:MULTISPECIES: Mth938-like domain-containing protein [unclassified Yoonia]